MEDEKKERRKELKMYRISCRIKRDRRKERHIYRISFKRDTQ